MAKKQPKPAPAEQPPPQKPDLLKDAKQVAVWAAILYGCLSLILLGTQTAVIKLLTKPGELTDEAVVFYINVFTQASPLTLGLTAVGILWTWWLRGNDPNKMGGFFGMMLCTALILVISSAVGNNLGAGQKVRQQQLVGNLPLGLGIIINSLYSYYRAYEGALFFSSLAVAGLLIAVWAIKIEPRLRAWIDGKGGPDPITGPATTSQK